MYLYNALVTFRSLLVFSVVLLAAGCNRVPKNNEAIRQGVIEHLAKNSGLDVNSMNIAVTSVQYRGDEADAVVSFQPKNMPGGGMSMTYTLEAKGNKWIVKKKAGSGMGAHPGAEMPGGTGATGQMPPGHPSVGGAAGANPETPAKK